MMDPMTAPAPAEAGQPMPQGEDPMGGGTTQQASPEEQKQYETIVGSAFNMIYDKTMLPKITQILEGGGDPKAGLARAASLVMVKIYTSAKQAGQEFSGEVMFHAGKEVFEDLAELSKEAGIYDFSENPDDLEGAYFLTLDQFRMDMQEAGMLDTEAAKADFAKLQQMDQSGGLEQMLMRLSENDGADNENTEGKAEERGEHSGPNPAEPKEPGEKKYGKSGGMLRGGM